MFISTRRLKRMIDQIEALEREVIQLKRRTSVYVAEEGLLVGWEGSGASILDAINSMAKHIKFRWKQVYARPASLEADASKK